MPILSTRGLRLDIGGATIVADVSLEVAEGEFLGIIGPNGAGKTSLFNLLSGLYRPTAGSVELDGREITRDAPYRRARAGLGRTFQVSSVFPRLAALENVRLAAESALAGRCGFGAGRIERARRSSARAGRSSGSASARAARPLQDRSRTATSASSSSRCCLPRSRA